MIQGDYFWINIFILAVGTLVIRGSIIAVSHKVRISDRVRSLLAFIPAAILPAFIAPMVFFHQGQAQWILGKERLFVTVLATVVCFYSRNMIVTVCFGLICLYMFTQIL